MRFPNDLSLGGVIAQALENAKEDGKTINWIADEIDYSRHMLYKCADLSDPSSLPTSKLIPFMRAVDNYEILKFLARHCGFVIFKIPKKNHFENLTELQKTLFKTVSALYKFWNDEISLEEVRKEIDEAISGLAGARAACEKRDKKQGELEIED